jgi:hypothetical protein
MRPETIASLTTAAGTLVLAVATFSATRSANRASRIAERSLLASLRPVLVHAQLGDSRQKIGFADDHWVHVEGSSAAFDVEDDAIYLAFGLRNVGTGMAILQSWYPIPERVLSGQMHRPVEEFRPQTRALYVPSGGLGFWQGALRDPGEQVFSDFKAAAAARQAVTIDLLYSDMNGGQRTVTRLSILPAPSVPSGRDDPSDPHDSSNKKPRWIASIGTHWLIDDHTSRRFGPHNAS